MGGPATITPDATMTAAPFRHQPVMGRQVAALFADVPAGVIVDATLGGGGHAALILETRPDVHILGLDRDQSALAAAQVNLARFGNRVTMRHVRFDLLGTVMTELDIADLSGALFDLGVSSPQLDWAERGFSYRHDGPLDMRMDQTHGRSAADIVNGSSIHELADLLRDYSDERFASRIARAIVAARPITSTTRLADVVREAIPAPARRTGGHPAKRTFQALRIAVNGELDVLPVALGATIAALKPGGRVLAIAYHSGEDRIVKHCFRQAATGGCTCPPGLPCGCGAVRTVRLIKQGSIRPSSEEIAENPRAESARLRAAEKLAGTHLVET
jgi:16S rRNA (cytosine1402-N4)-methyltransferase